jgi:hypothetical protein
LFKLGACGVTHGLMTLAGLLGGEILTFVAARLTVLLSALRGELCAPL